MKLHFITFLVPDLEKSVAFYTELVGLTVQYRISPPVGEICFMANAEGETMLEFIQLKDGPVFTGEGMTVSFKYEGELAHLREKAIAMGYVPSELHLGGPAPVNFTVNDPAGIEVEFCN